MNWFSTFENGVSRESGARSWYSFGSNDPEGAQRAMMPAGGEKHQGKQREYGFISLHDPQCRPRIDPRRAPRKNIVTAGKRGIVAQRAGGIPKIVRHRPHCTHFRLDIQEN